MAEELKGIRIDEFKVWSEQWKKHHAGCIASDGEFLGGDRSLNM